MQPCHENNHQLDVDSCRSSISKRGYRCFINCIAFISFGANILSSDSVPLYIFISYKTLQTQYPEGDNFLPVWKFLYILFIVYLFFLFTLSRHFLPQGLFCAQNVSIILPLLKGPSSQIGMAGKRNHWMSLSKDINHVRLKDDTFISLLLSGFRSTYLFNT